LDELQATVLRVKLNRLEEDNQRRMRIARMYQEELRRIPDLALPSSTPGTTHVYHQYVVRCTEPSVRNRLMAHLSTEGIQTAVHYPVPVHLQPAYADRLARFLELPATEDVCPRILSLPLFPELTDEEVGRVAKAIETFFSRSV
jgi:dTDP-4-amino-4,6-dideoxygalactose transaminase